MKTFLQLAAPVTYVHHAESAECAENS